MLSIVLLWGRSGEWKEGEKEGGMRRERGREGVSERMNLDEQVWIQCSTVHFTNGVAARKQTTFGNVPMCPLHSHAYLRIATWSAPLCPRMENDWPMT